MTSQSPHPQPPGPRSSSALVPSHLAQTLGQNWQAHPAFRGEKKQSGTKRGGSCLLRSLVGTGPCDSHHRRLKTKLAVRMMPRRRVKGSQVFTNAPMLTYFPYSRQKKHSVIMFQLVLLL